MQVRTLRLSHSDGDYGDIRERPIRRGGGMVDAQE